MKRLFFAVTCLLAMLGAQAQTEVGSFEIRPMAGLSVTGFRGSDAEGSKHTLNAVAGGEIEYRAAAPLGISAGALFSWQGCDFDNDNDIKTSMELFYLNIPVLLNYYITDNFAVKAGVQPGLLLNSKVKAEKNGNKAEVDSDKMFKSFDLAIPMGCSYSFGRFQIDARYNLSVTNIIKKEAHILGETIKADGHLYNSVFQLTLGYNFSL